MGHKAKLSREQAGAGVYALEQPQRAEHGSRRAQWKRKPEPRALTERGQIVDLEADWAALAADEPPPHVVQAG